MKTLYVSDLDGTLLNQNDSLSKYTIDTLNRLVDQGMLFTYATARSLNSASIVTKGLNTKIPVIAYNGAFIFEPDTGKILSSHYFQKDDIGYIKEELQRFKISPFVYSFMKGKQNVAWNRMEENEGKQRYLSMRKGDKRFHPVCTEEALYDGEVFYVTCIGERKELEEAYTKLKQNEALRCTFQQELYRTEYWLEIMPKEVSKKNGIIELKRILQCDRIVSFGDAINDIPMFQISDECYAVENAVSDLKEIATGVIGSNEEDGVVKWLVEHK